MASAKPESDPMFELLTDALRAGPGSPQWSSAVAQLRTRGADGDEQRMLIDARQTLAAGQNYRQIRAGPGFTRRLFSRVNAADGASGRSLFTHQVIAVVAALVIVVILGLIGFWMLPGPKLSAGVEQLWSTYFSTVAGSVTFDRDLPNDWKAIGTLPLDPARGLRPSGTPATRPGVLGGGVYWTNPIPADQPTAVEAIVRIGRPNDDASVQVFVTDQPDFSVDRGASPHELVWQNKGTVAQVFLPSGRSDGMVEKQKDVKEKTVRIVFNRDVAGVEMNGKRLWSGEHGLAGDKLRYVGVRVIRSGADKPDAITITSLRILRP